MSDYPTAYRGMRSAQDAGFPRDAALMAGAGFLAPAAARSIALIDLAAATPALEAITPAVEAVSETVTATARAGLRIAPAVLGRAFWPIALALVAWELAQAWRRYSKPQVRLPVGSFTVARTHLCNGSDQVFTTHSSPFGTVTRCVLPLTGAGPWLLTAGAVNNKQDGGVLPPGTLVFTTGEYLGLSSGIQAYSPGREYSRSAAQYAADLIQYGRYGTPQSVMGAWVPGPIYIGDDAPSYVTEVVYDPLSLPVGAPVPEPQVLPWKVLPYRDTNPNRADSEQSQRGYIDPWFFEQGSERLTLAGELVGYRGQPAHWPRYFTVSPGRVQRKVAPGSSPPVQLPLFDPEVPPHPGPADLPETEVWPGFADPLELPEYEAPPGSPEVVPQTAPDLLPGEIAWPWGDLPGWVAEVIPSVDGIHDPDPIRQEFPEGAAGPTIIIGGGPPVGPHLHVPPGPKEKERKARRLGTGGMLAIRKGVNPVTEALEVVQCAYQALPKGVRWKTQQADWKSQRDVARRDGVTFSKRPESNVAERSPKIDLGMVLGESWKGQSITLPGGVRNPKFARPGESYMHELQPQAKLRAVYENANLLDIDKMVKCIAANQVEDMIHGRIGNQAGKAAKVLGRHHGIQAGPVF